tara:strand:- start:3398 stop:3589 length:192 start_codon:yes stop_codon:yes gene_type:complete
MNTNESMEKHNYSSLMVKYLSHRVEALEKALDKEKEKTKTLTGVLEFKQIQIEKLIDEKRTHI